MNADIKTGDYPSPSKTSDGVPVFSTHAAKDVPMQADTNPAGLTSTRPSLDSRKSVYSEGELEEDIMDISGSEMDEGEILDELDSSNARNTEGLNEGEVSDSPDESSTEDSIAKIQEEGMDDDDSEISIDQRAPGLYEDEVTIDTLASGAVDDVDSIANMDDEETYEPPNDIATSPQDPASSSHADVDGLTPQASNAYQIGDASGKSFVPSEEFASGSGDLIDAPSRGADRVGGGGSEKADTGFTNLQADEQVLAQPQTQHSKPLDDDSGDDYEPRDTTPFNNVAQDLAADSTVTVKLLSAADRHDVCE